MASPQVENGYIKIANELMAALCCANLAGPEFMVALTVITRTYGWNKKEDQISLTQFQKLTKMHRPRIVRAIKGLVRQGVLGSSGGSTSSASTYWIIKDYDKWRIEAGFMHSTSLTSSDSRTRASSDGERKLVPTVVPTQHNKNNIKTVRPLATPLDHPFFKNGLFLKTWEDFLAMRKGMRKPAGPRAQELLIRKLDGIEVEVAVKMVEQSIMNSYLGIFPLKQDFISNGIKQDSPKRGILEI